jgi:putative oxidoreductase
VSLERAPKKCAFGYLYSWQCHAIEDGFDIATRQFQRSVMNRRVSSDISLAHFAPHVLAALRIVAAALFLQHGLVKLVGFPEGASPGQQPPLTLLGLAGIIEAATGILMILGLFTRTAALIASGEMAVGYWLYHAARGFYPAVNGGEAAILFCFIFLYIFFAGPGTWSLDGVQRRGPTEERFS